MQPIFEHRYGQALAFAEASLSRSAADKFLMDRWLANPTGSRVRRGSRAHHYELRTPRDVFPGGMFTVTSLRDPVGLIGVPWTTPAPASMAAVLATPEALADVAWRLRALKTARFDTQIPTLFIAAVANLLGNAEQLLLDERIAQSVSAAPPLRPKRL